MANRPKLLLQLYLDGLDFGVEEEQTAGDSKPAPLARFGGQHLLSAGGNPNELAPTMHAILGI